MIYIYLRIYTSDIYVVLSVSDYSFRIYRSWTFKFSFFEKVWNTSELLNILKKCPFTCKVSSFSFPVCLVHETTIYVSVSSSRHGSHEINDLFDFRDIHVDVTTYYYVYHFQVRQRCPSFSFFFSQRELEKEITSISKSTRRNTNTFYWFTRICHRVTTLT